MRRSLSFLAVVLFAVLAGSVTAQQQPNPNFIVPTAPLGTNNNQAASTAFVQSAVGSGTGCSPASGTCLDLLTGFSGTGLMRRTGAGTYTFGTAVALGSEVSGTLLAAQFPALSGDVTTSAGSLATTIAANAITNAKFRQGAARTVVGVTGNATANVADIQGTTDQVLRINGAGTALSFGAIDLSKTAAATGVIQAASFPALTGDVTTASGALGTTLATTQGAVHTWSLTQTFTQAPVFTDASGSRTALGLAAVAASGSASDLTAGTLAAARGGAGTINGALKGNGSGVVSQAACADLSNASGLCSATYASSSSWTPADASGASLTFTSVNAKYTQIGNMYFVYGSLTYPSTASGLQAELSGLPAIPNQSYAATAAVIFSTGGTVCYMRGIPNSTAVVFHKFADNTSCPNSALSTQAISFVIAYPAS